MIFFGGNTTEILATIQILLYFRRDIYITECNQNNV